MPRRRSAAVLNEKDGPPQCQKLVRWADLIGAKLALGSARIARCETGWGDGPLTRTVRDDRLSPHPSAPIGSVDPPPEAISSTEHSETGYWPREDRIMPATVDLTRGSSFRLRPGYSQFANNLVTAPHIRRLSFPFKFSRVSQEVCLDGFYGVRGALFASLPLLCIRAMPLRSPCQRGASNYLASSRRPPAFFVPLDMRRGAIRIEKA